MVKQARRHVTHVNRIDRAISQASIIHRSQPGHRQQVEQAVFVAPFERDHAHTGNRDGSHDDTFLFTPRILTIMSSSLAMMMSRSATAINSGGTGRSPATRRSLLAK